ncbi:MAG: DnaD domain protein [Lachnospiraceae bacterium]|nr:DnaD domain protein [Lachnospiraceae bacterium]
MGTIKLDGSTGSTATLVSNRFLDEYMPNANGEFVKIYLYLLRAFSGRNTDISVCHIADVFNHTEKDVLRALKYWEQAGLLDLCFNSDKSLTNITLKPFGTDYTMTDGTQIEIQSTVSPAISTTVETLPNDSQASASPKPAQTSGKNTTKSGKRTYTASELAEFKSKEEVMELLYLAEKYIGKTLSGADVNSLLYIYDVLGFEPDLVEYLIEYCVTNGHKSFRYIEKVALSWADDGICTVEEARANTDLFSKSCYPVLKAFGLNGRNPGEGEKALIIKWTNSYGFTMDIILDACNRTINTIHQPSFEYADSILTKWKEKGIKTLTDIQALDNEHQQNKAASARNTKNPSANNNNNNETIENKSKNSFNDFNQRSYNYEALEKELLGNI